MGYPQFKSAFSRNSAAIVAASAITLGAFSTAANAQDNCGNCHAGSYETDHSIAFDASKEFADKNDRVGIVISSGPGVADPVSIGERFVEVIEERSDYSAKYFIVHRPEKGQSIALNFKTWGTDPEPAQTAASLLTKRLEYNDSLEKRIENIDLGDRHIAALTPSSER